MKVAILGAGRMGALLGARMPGNVRKVIISRDRTRATALADEVGAVASDQVTAVRGCDVVFMAVPGSAVPGLLEMIEPHLSRTTLVANMATEVDTGALAARHPGVRLVAVKVIGHAREIALGSPGAVVLDGVRDQEEAILSPLLEGLGSVHKGPEAQVLSANTIVAEEMIRAEAALRERLKALHLPAELVDAAVETTAPGVLRAVAKGDAGPFLTEVLRRVRDYK